MAAFATRFSAAVPLFDLPFDPSAATRTAPPLGGDRRAMPTSYHARDRWGPYYKCRSCGTNRADRYRGNLLAAMGRRRCFFGRMASRRIADAYRVTPTAMRRQCSRWALRQKRANNSRAATERPAIRPIHMPRAPKS